jgi:hypothetical protein
MADETNNTCCNFDVEFESVDTVAENNHDALVNRDWDNQHPISAITGLQQYLDICCKIVAKTCCEWNQMADFVPEKNWLIIYTDGVIDAKGRAIPKFKFGDGNAYLIDLPFVGQDITNELECHIHNSDMHVTAEEKEMIVNLQSTLDAKVSCKVEENEDGINLIFY